MFRWLKFLFLALSLIIFAGIGLQIASDSTAFTSALPNMAFSNNFNVVVPGRFYRSAQMSTQALDETIKKNGIKTVIDLRLDPNEKDDGSITEKWAAEINGATYYQVRLASSKLPSPERLSELLNIYDRAELPILAHCSSGTHRTGFASFLWLIDKEQAPLEQALDQLTAKYGFFLLERKLKAWSQSKPTLDTLIWDYRDALANGNGQDMRTKNFRDWALNYLSEIFRANGPQI